jgi:Transmembrane secretion effector
VRRENRVGTATEPAGAAAADRQPGSFWRQTFSSLKVPNYRLYFAGQSISLAGTWMQMTAQSWLVLTLTHSPTDLGFAVALQTLPILFLAPYGGVVADRTDKRRLMVVLQLAMGVQALVLGLLTVFGVVRFWEVCVLAVILGLNNAFENSARQAFVREMVGQDELRNAITLNSVTVNAARAVGPAIGGVLIATAGIGVCFLLNAASFGAVVTSLVIMDKSALRPSSPAPRARGQLREGLRYAAQTPTTQHARPGHRAVAGRLPGNDADRRAADRVDHRCVRPARRPGRRRSVLPGRRGRGQHAGQALPRGAGTCPQRGNGGPGRGPDALAGLASHAHPSRFRGREREWTCDYGRARPLRGDGRPGAGRAAR